MAIVKFVEYFLNMKYYREVNLKTITHVNEHYLYAVDTDGNDLRIERKYITEITLK